MEKFRLCTTFPNSLQGLFPFSRFVTRRVVRRTHSANPLLSGLCDRMWSKLPWMLKGILVILDFYYKVASQLLHQRRLMLDCMLLEGWEISLSQVHCSKTLHATRTFLRLYTEFRVVVLLIAQSLPRFLCLAHCLVDYAKKIVLHMSIQNFTNFGFICLVLPLSPCF